MMVRLILERKGIPYQRRDLMPILSKPILRTLRFPTHTIPALRIDGQRLQGSGAIARELERIQPEPPIFPSDPQLLAEVEQAEKWGEDDFQPLVRRILWRAIRLNPPAMRSIAEGAKLGVPIGLAVRTAAPIIAAELKLHGATEDQVRTDLAALPGAFSRIDDWIAAGVLGGAEPNVADLQIATSVRLAMVLDDVRPFVESRPAGEMAL